MQNSSIKQVLEEIVNYVSKPRTSVGIYYCCGEFEAGICLEINRHTATDFWSRGYTLLSREEAIFIKRFLYKRFCETYRMAVCPYVVRRSYPPVEAGYWFETDEQRLEFLKQVINEL